MTSAYLSITFFFLVLIAGCFYCWKRRDPWVNHAIGDFMVRRAFLILGIYLLAMLGGLMLDMSACVDFDPASHPTESHCLDNPELYAELKIVTILLLRSGYLALMYTMVKTLIDALQMNKDLKKNRRLGEGGFYGR